MPLSFHWKRRISPAGSMKIPTSWQGQPFPCAKKWNRKIRTNVEQTRLPVYYNVLIYSKMGKLLLLLWREISEATDLLSKKPILSGREVLRLQNYVIYCKYGYKNDFLFSIAFIFCETCTSNVEQIRFIKNQFITVKHSVTP